ncbi:MAG TPA: helix-turn-helix domain-containing protein [Micromonosporaceae bacterium]
MSSDHGSGKRPYDSRRRRERAQEERRATRNRVLEAATRLFVANGYTGTTMADIAREAGVAMQSVYAAGRSKADLLHEAVDRAVAGDDQGILVQDRPTFTAIAAEPDPVRQLHLLADLICGIQARSAPIQAAYRQAAAIDSTVAASVEAAHRRRLEAFGAAIRMLPADRLRYSPQECVDTIWAVASSEVFLLLLNVRGWTWDDIRPWLARTFIDILLTEDRPEPPV